MTRKERLFKNNEPRYLRIYSNKGTKEETQDHLTIIFTGRYRKTPFDDYLYIGANDSLSVSYWGFSDFIIDSKGYANLGRKIAFKDLSKAVQNYIAKEYCELWSIND